MANNLFLNKKNSTQNFSCRVLFLLLAICYVLVLGNRDKSTKISKKKPDGPTIAIDHPITKGPAIAPSPFANNSPADALAISEGSKWSFVWAISNEYSGLADPPMTKADAKSTQNVPPSSIAINAATAPITAPEHTKNRLSMRSDNQPSGYCSTKAPI